MQCDNCRFWKCTISVGKSAARGECRRHNPRAQGMMWATTAFDDWCGEFQEKEKTEDVRSIDELDLSARASNCLKLNKITTIEDLCRQTSDDLLDLRNLGETTLNEICENLKERGLSLRSNPY